MMGTGITPRSLMTRFGLSKFETIFSPNRRKVDLIAIADVSACRMLRVAAGAGRGEDTPLRPPPYTPQPAPHMRYTRGRAAARARPSAATRPPHHQPPCPAARRLPPTRPLGPAAAGPAPAPHYSATPDCPAWQPRTCAPGLRPLLSRHGHSPSTPLPRPFPRFYPAPRAPLPSLGRNPATPFRASHRFIGGKVIR